MAFFSSLRVVQWCRTRVAKNRKHVSLCWRLTIIESDVRRLIDPFFFKSCRVNKNVTWWCCVFSLFALCGWTSTCRFAANVITVSSVFVWVRVLIVYWFFFVYNVCSICVQLFATGILWHAAIAWHGRYCAGLWQANFAFQLLPLWIGIADSRAPFECGERAL